MVEELELHTLKETAGAFRVSPHTVRAWVRQGKLRPTRICRRLLFTTEELRRFVTSGVTNGPE